MCTNNEFYNNFGSVCFSKNLRRGNDNDFIGKIYKLSYW